MIRIGKPYVYEENGTAFLKAPIEISDDTAKAYMGLQTSLKKVHWRLNENYPPAEWKLENGGLWFSVPAEYGKYLCAERSDAFIVAMLWYAMITGSDIETEIPASEKLVFSVNQFLIPALCRKENGYRRIQIKAPTTDQPLANANGVGTGMSCGIDSLYTTRVYTENVPSNYRLTHLAYFNMGAIFHPGTKKKEYNLKEFYETTDKMSEEKLKNAAEVAAAVGLPILYVCSNMDSDYYRGAYGYTAVYRNCACVLALQGLFGKYYCSSGGWPDYYDLSLSEGSEHYESLLCVTLSTENCEFILSDYVTRIEKTAAIADWEIAWKYLDVCFKFHNCGRCHKCYRTLVTLDILGYLDQFAPSFDVEAYKKNRANAFGWLLYTRLGDEKNDNAVFARDIYELAKERNFTFPSGSKYHCWKRMIRKPIVKMLQKIRNKA